VKPTTIFTITTGTGYQYGVFALINSLRAMGADHPVVVGTDRFLPELANVAGVSQFLFELDWNGTNLKAFTILQQQAERFIYIDADIILTDPDFLPAIELALDERKFVVPIDGIVSQNELRRGYWRSMYPATAPVLHNFYYNAGFFAGLLSAHEWLLKDWIALNQKHLDLKAFLFDHKRLPMADQDTLNAVLQTVPPADLATVQMPDWRSIALPVHPFFHIGNFRPHAFLHCTGKHKPWLVRGIPPRSPNAYDEAWYHYTFERDQPVKAGLRATFGQKQWFKRTKLSRLAVKLKKMLKLP